MTDQPHDKQAQEQSEKKRQRKPRGRGKGEGSVFKRGDNRTKPWVAQLTLDNRKKAIIGYYKTEAEAITARNKALRALEQGIWVDHSKQTITEYLDYWLEHVHKPLIAITTYGDYREMIHLHIIPALGHIPVQKLTMRQVQMFCSKLQETLGPGRVKNIMSLLHGALEHAVQEGLVARNVSHGVKLPRQETTERHVLTLEQASKLFEATSQHWLKVLFAVAVTTGLRRGELVSLKWQDLDIEKRTLQVQRNLIKPRRQPLRESGPKTPRSKRKITLPVFVMELLQEHRKNQEKMCHEAGDTWQEKGLIFCNEHGDYFGLIRLERALHRLLATANLPQMRLHDLRHSAFTILLSMGVPAKVVQEIAGHSNINTTLGIYGHVIPGMHENAMGIWDNELGERTRETRANLRLQWSGYSATTQTWLEMLMGRYGEDAALFALNAIKNL